MQIEAVPSSLDQANHALSGAEAAPWCAVRVKPRAERVAADGLAGKGYESFLPLYLKQAQWSDRIKAVQTPMFPGYVFCRYESTGKPPIVATPGVVGILSFGSQIAVVSNDEIDALRAVVRSGVLAEPWPYAREGERVRIHAGVMAGTEGLLVRAKSNWRVVLSVEALCRSVAIEVDRDATSPLTRSSRPFPS